jgi:hypothetical protein
MNYEMENNDDQLSPIELKDGRNSIYELTASNRSNHQKQSPGIKGKSCLKNNSTAPF